MSVSSEVAGLLPSGRSPSSGAVRLMRVDGVMCVEKTRVHETERQYLGEAEYRLLVSTLCTSRVVLPKLISLGTTEAGSALTYELVKGRTPRVLNERRYWSAIEVVLRWCCDTREQRVELAGRIGMERSLSRPEECDVLVHGDLSPDNLLVGDRGIGIIDWDDVTCAHVWTDAASLLLLSLVQRGGLTLRDAVAVIVEGSPATCGAAAKSVGMFQAMSCDCQSRLAALRSLASVAVRRESSAARSNSASVEWWLGLDRLLGSSHG